MDRHDLQENDLAEFFRNSGEWWAKYGQTLLIVLIILALGVAGFRWYNHWTTQAHNTAWTELAETTSPEGYLEVARLHADPAVQALAYLRGADLFRQRAIAPASSDETANTSASPEQDLAQAQTMYEHVHEMKKAHPVYRANALLGLAAVAESQRQWDAAQAHYDQAIELTQDTFPAIAAQARTRRGFLSEIQKGIVFAPEPSPAATTQPATQPTLEIPGFPGAAGAETSAVESDPSAPQVNAAPPATQPATESTE